MQVNRGIYNRNYSEAALRPDPRTAFDRSLIELRRSIVSTYAPRRDVLDLCCGTGEYLIPALGQVRTAIGLDFSRNLLNVFRRHIPAEQPVVLIEADAAQLPLRASTVDFVFSFSSLYQVPDVECAIKEVGRVLRPGGYAALELGNLYSLNTVVSSFYHRHFGWGRSFPISYRRIIRQLRQSGLDVIRRHSFQLLPMYGANRSLFFLYPLLTGAWKGVLGRHLRGRILDEWLSGCWPLRFIAFRHLFVTRKA